MAAREDHWKRIKRAWQVDVLAAKSWSSMTWHDLDENLERFRPIKEPQSRAYINALRAWRGEIEARVDVMLAAIRLEAIRLEAEPAWPATRRHSPRRTRSRSFYFSRFTDDSTAPRCSSRSTRRTWPGKIGAVLGLEALVLPAPPGRA